MLPTMSRSCPVISLLCSPMLDFRILYALVPLEGRQRYQLVEFNSKPFDHHYLHRDCLDLLARQSMGSVG